MKNRSEIPMDMITEFELSKADALKVKAYSVFDYIRKGMNEASVYSFCRTTADEVHPYFNEWAKMHKLELVG